MIAFLKGTVEEVSADSCYIDVNGVGYKVFIPLSNREQLVVGNSVKLLTYHYFKEDLQALYGFLTKSDQDLFIKVLTVSGVGPKTALNIVSVLGPEAFISAVKANNLALLTKIPNVGKKTAERIVLELKDKLETVATTFSQDAFDVLIALGYKSEAVQKVLPKCQQSASIEQIVKQALKLL